MKNSVRKHVVFSSVKRLVNRAKHVSRGYEWTNGHVPCLAVSLVVSHLRQCGAGGSAPNPNTGALLLGFLRRFGHDFDYGRMAVAAARASGVTRAKDLVVHPGAFGRRPMVLAEDPQVGLCKLKSLV